MERTLETTTINNALEVVRLKGELKFKHPLGYTRPSGYCFKHPVKGFFAFKGDAEPYELLQEQSFMIWIDNGISISHKIYKLSECGITPLVLLPYPVRI